MTPSWRALQDTLDGEVLLPDAPGYGPASTSFNARFDVVRPQAVVRCATPHDVAETIAFAAHHELHAVARSGGHSFAGHSSTTGIVVDVTPMHSVDVDAGTVTIGAGARLGDINDALQAHDLTIAGGTCPGVGIAGLTLGGGLGILGRKHGLTSDQLAAADVVLADGRVVAADERHHPDLFWALRGAGAGTFGVVTAFVFRTVPAPRVSNLHLTWPDDQAAAVVAAWQRWAPTAPDELAASLKITTTDDPDVPPSVDVYGALVDDESAARALLDALVAAVGSDPSSAWLDSLSYPATRRFWADLPVGAHQPLAGLPAADDDGHPYLVSKSEFFDRALPADAIDRLLATFRRHRTRGQARELDFMPWGGAYRRVPTHATAFAHRDQLFQLKHSAVIDADATSTARRAAARQVHASWAAVHDYGSGGVFPNFADPDLHQWDRAYHGANLERLLRVKARYDPTDVFRH